MGKRLVVTTSWFFLVLLTLIGALYCQYTITQTQELAALIKSYNRTPFEADIGSLVFAPRAAGEVFGAIITHDARSAILEQFFRRYRSPLVGHSRYFVEVADSYGLDYRLLPAIAMQESGGGKLVPYNSYNAWGYGIHEAGTLRFDSWDEAINEVALGISKNYIGQGLRTPEEIMTKYTPASLAKGGAWAKGVRFFMDQMH